MNRPSKELIGMEHILFDKQTLFAMGLACMLGGCAAHGYPDSMPPAAQQALRASTMKPDGAFTPVGLHKARPDGPYSPIGLSPMKPESGYSPIGLKHSKTRHR